MELAIARAEQVVQGVPNGLKVEAPDTVTLGNPVRQYIKPKVKPDGCAQNVTNALNALDGVWATVTYADHTARVRSKQPIDRGALEAAVKDAGYYVMTL